MVTSSGGRVTISSIGTGTCLDDGGGSAAAIECAFQDDDDVEKGNCRNGDIIPIAEYSHDDDGQSSSQDEDDGDDHNSDDDSCENSQLNSQQEVAQPNGQDDGLVSAESIQRFLEEKLRMNKDMVSSSALPSTFICSHPSSLDCVVDCEHSSSNLHYR